MIKLKNLIETFNLNEITEKTVLYHRSWKKFKPGDIIDPSNSGNEGKDETGAHWLSKKFWEVKLEEYRRQHHQNQPSRFDCVYCSVIPQSAFIGKGYLYEVKPIGKIHVTMAYYIDLMGEINDRAERDYREWGRDVYDYPEKEREDAIKRMNERMWRSHHYEFEEMFERYWSKEHGDQLKSDTKWVEVLCEKVEVVSEFSEESHKHFKVGDRIRLKQDIEVDNFYGHKSSGNHELSEEELKRVLDTFHGKKNDSDWTKSYTLKIPKGTTGKISKSFIAAIRGRASSFSHIPYRSLVMTPDGFDIYIDLLSVVSKLTSHDKRVKTEDIIEKI